MAEIRLTTLECKRCGHKWNPRKQDIKVCPNPKCHSPYWNIERKITRKENDCG
jgi:Zn finger protein HypA/HybF involved in hydrogenase expression